MPLADKQEGNKPHKSTAPTLCTVQQSFDTHDCDSNCPAMLAAPHSQVWQLFCLRLSSNKKETKRHPRDCVPVATLQTISPTGVP